MTDASMSRAERNDDGLAYGWVALLTNPRRCSVLVRGLIGLLVISLCLWMLVGIVHLLLALYEAASGKWTGGAEHMIVNVLTLLALLEIIRTLQSYLEIGRVRVTFILDAALVVLTGELIGLWYKEHTPTEVGLSLVVISWLVVLRIITMRFSPDSGEGQPH